MSKRCYYDYDGKTNADCFCQLAQNKVGRSLPWPFGSQACRQKHVCHCSQGCSSNLTWRRLSARAPRGSLRQARAQRDLQELQIRHGMRRAKPRGAAHSSGVSLSRHPWGAQSWKPSSGGSCKRGSLKTWCPKGGGSRASLCRELMSVGVIL